MIMVVDAVVFYNSIINYLTYGNYDSRISIANKYFLLFRVVEVQ